MQTGELSAMWSRRSIVPAQLPAVPGPKTKPLPLELPVWEKEEEGDHWQAGARQQMQGSLIF
jgi:hypothetical protein